MRRLATAGLILATFCALGGSTATAQVRAIAGVGLGVPVGDFADDNGYSAQSGGATALAGIEWLPGRRNFGIRVDAAWNRFCTSACDPAGGSLDIRYRFLNVNVNGLVELPVGGNPDFRPYLTAGAGVYGHKLEGDDAPEHGFAKSVTDVGVNGGLGVLYTLGRVGVFAEGRLHNIFVDGSDIQYIPVMLGAKIALQ